MDPECKFDSTLLYLPGMDRGRPPLTDALRKYVWRESGYCCAMPKCRAPGVEVHHIVPWREAIFRSGSPHPADRLIALCPACHALADNEEITRSELSDIKAHPLAKRGTISAEQPTYLDTVAAEDDVFLLHLREWHREFVYRGRSSQYRDYLYELRRYLRKAGRLDSIKGVGVLAALGGVLRRQGSRHFRAAYEALWNADALVQDLTRTKAVCELLGRIRYDLGYIAFLRNDYDASLPFLDASIEMESKADNKVGMRMSGSIKVLVLARKTGDSNLRQLRENLSVFTDIEHPDAARWVVNCQAHLAECCLRDTGDPEVALEYLEGASRNHDRFGLGRDRAKLLCLFGSAFAELGKADKALSALSAALVLYRELGVSEGFANVCYVYGKALEANGQVAEAQTIYRLGISADPDMDNQCGIARCHERIQSIGASGTT